MIRVKVIWEHTCDKCGKIESNQWEHPYFDGMEYPDPASNPYGWFIVSFWKSGYQFVLCPSCYAVYKEKLNEIGLRGTRN